MSSDSQSHAENDTPSDRVGSGSLENRVDRVEETVGFLERGVDRSSVDIDDLSKAVHELSIRLQRLEGRLMDLHDRIETTDPGLVPPPHSAGPDISRDPL